jgi:hypothetical protein
MKLKIIRKSIKKKSTKKYSKIIELNIKTNVHYVICIHDYTIINFLNNYNRNFQDNGYLLKLVVLRLVGKNPKIFFIHGYRFGDLFS